MSSESCAICSQSQKIVKFAKLMALMFGIVRVRVIRQMFKLQLMIEKLRPDVLTLYTILFDHRPKCANIAPARTNVYETTGDRRVKLRRKRRFWPWLCSRTRRPTFWGRAHGWRPVNISVWIELRFNIVQLTINSMKPGWKIYLIGAIINASGYLTLTLCQTDNAKSKNGRFFSRIWADP